MVKHFCDRCGRRIINSRDRRRVIFESEDDEICPCAVWDLCDPCAVELKKVMVDDINKNLIKRSNEL